MKFPVLSAPVQRALPGAAVAGGAVQASFGWGAFGPSEGADQASIAWGLPMPSEGADQSAVSAQRPFGPSEGADQAGFMNAWGPSES